MKYKPFLNLADEVLAFRIQKGWSQSELAKYVGTKQSNISHIESGLANPTIKFLQKLAKAFDTDLEITFHPHKYLEWTRILPIIISSPEDVWDRPRRVSWEASSKSPQMHLVKR
jgi:HTH-type transcriptional regulator/antitoxin HipB